MRHWCWSDIRRGVFPLLLCVLRPRVTGADPASHRVRLWRGVSASTVPFSFFLSFLRAPRGRLVSVFLWFQPLPLSPLLFGRGVRGHRRLDLF